MKKNGILTLLFAFIPGAGEMYQGYMKRGLSLITLFCLSTVLGAETQISLFYLPLPVVYMYSFFDTFNLRAQISQGTAPADDYLFHLDPKDKRLMTLLADSHKLVGWVLIAFGALVAYQNIVMNTLGDLLWRWGQNSPFFRALYLVMDQLPEIVVCVALIVCGVWLVKGPKTAKQKAPEEAPSEEEFPEYQPAPKKIDVQSILSSITHPEAPENETTEDDDGTDET